MPVTAPPVPAAEATRRGGSPCAARWAFKGRADPKDPRRVGIGCDDPHELVCRCCGRTLLARCGTSRSRACGPCGTAYRGRVGHVARSGLRRTVSREGLFITVTAPSGVPHRLPSGRLCPCTPAGGLDLAVWNAECSQRPGAGGKVEPGRWNRFILDLRRLSVACPCPGHLVTRGQRKGQRLKSTTCRDRCGCCRGGRLYPFRRAEYFKGAEVQRRGALHFHVLVRDRDGRVLAISKREVRRLAVKHGFGHEVDVQPVQPKHAGYVAKYASKSADDRQDVPWRGWRQTGGTWVRKDTGEVCERPRRMVRSWRPTYRTWTASRRWGDSMRDVRAAQAHYVATVTCLPVWADREASPAWGLLADVPDRPDPPT